MIYSYFVLHLVLVVGHMATLGQGYPVTVDKDVYGRLAGDQETGNEAHRRPHHAHEAIPKLKSNEAESLEVEPEVDDRSEEKSSSHEDLSVESSESVESRTESVFESVETKKDTFSENAEESDEIHIEHPRTNRDKIVRGILLDTKRDVDDLLGFTTPAPRKEKAVTEQHRPKSTQISEPVNRVTQETKADHPAPPVPNINGPKYFDPLPVDVELRELLTNEAKLEAQSTDWTTTPPPQTTEDLVAQYDRNLKLETEESLAAMFQIKAINIEPKNKDEPQVTVTSLGNAPKLSHPLRPNPRFIPIALMPRDIETQPTRPANYYSNIAKEIISDGIAPSGGQRELVPYRHENEHKGLDFRRVASAFAYPDVIEEPEPPQQDLLGNLQSLWNNIGTEVRELPVRMFDTVGLVYGSIVSINPFRAIVNRR